MNQRISVHPAGTNVARLESVSLTCEGIGYFPEIKWFQNGIAIEENNNNTRIIKYSSAQKATSNLSILVADIKHSGNYHCSLSVLDFIMESENALVLVQGEHS